MDFVPVADAKKTPIKGKNLVKILVILLMQMGIVLDVIVKSQIIVKMNRVLE
jgi:hypothetical protein